MYVRLFTAAVGYAICLSAAVAQSSQAYDLSFEECLERIRGAASQYGVAPLNVVETSDVRIVRFLTSDGSVLISCSRPDRKMVVTISLKR